MTKPKPSFLSDLRRGAVVCQLAQARVLVAVSGGADSVALTLGLHQLQTELQLSLVVAHVNHRLRGADSDSDAQWVAEWAQKLGLEYSVCTIDVTPGDQGTRESLEEAARRRRYEVLVDLAEQHQCGFIAVGHHADDWAETILHHIVRGTGLNGLRGMPQTRQLVSPSGTAHQLVRPLMHIPRSVILQWLEEQQQDFRLDASNQDVQFTRNRLRHELLPLLERDFNPQIRKTLVNLATQAREVSDWLQEVAAARWLEVRMDSQPDVLRVDAEALARDAVCLMREVLVHGWRANDWPLQDMSFHHWQQLAGLVSQPAGYLNLPGCITAQRRGTMLVLTRRRHVDP